MRSATIGGEVDGHGAAGAASAPERIDRSITRAILRGTYPPGTHLPTLRTLAEEHEVNLSTMQRALARLERRGLITARQGSGLLVNDPHEVGDLSLVADWLAVTADDPARAAAILADLLDVRRAIAARLIVRHRLAVLDALGDLVEGAASLVGLPLEGVWQADVAVARAVVGATGNAVAGAVLTTVLRVLDELPVLVAAMYAEPETNAASMLEVGAALRDGGPDLGARIEAAMAMVDERTVARFRDLLAREVAAREVVAP